MFREEEVKFYERPLAKDFLFDNLSRLIYHCKSLFPLVVWIELQVIGFYLAQLAAKVAKHLGWQLILCKMHGSSLTRFN